MKTENITTATAYCTSVSSCIYGFIKEIDWLTLFSFIVSLIVALTNFYFQRKKAVLEIKKIEMEMQLKENEAKTASDFLAKKRKLELDALERKLR